LTPDPIREFVPEFSLQVERFYARLMARARESAEADRSPSLGGCLFFAGELRPETGAMVVAANIAGAASLVATADGAAQKQAVRDGVVDFLVTSLDEALRIMKNEIRKGETVAVCVGKVAEAVETEMHERGVRPDLLRGEITGEEIAGNAGPEGILAWRVAASPTLWLPKLDALAANCLGDAPDLEGAIARRWLRLAPRYLGRLAQGVHLMRANRRLAARFLDLAEKRVAEGQIPVGVEIQWSRQGEAEVHRFNPKGTSA